MPDETLSHYDRLGGVEAIRAAVDKLYARILGDDRLAHYFAGVDVARVKRHQVLLLCALLGGPQTYDGRSLYEVHQGLGITPTDYDRVSDHLEDVLLAAGAGEGTLVAVSDALVGAKPEIVEVPGDP
jgi:hemoglobin